MFDPRQVHMSYVVYIVAVGLVFLLMLIFRLLVPFLPFTDAHSFSLYQKDVRAVTGNIQTKRCCLGYRKTFYRKACFLLYTFTIRLSGDRSIS
jgi:hypothetical protein